MDREIWGLIFVDGEKIDHNKLDIKKTEKLTLNVIKINEGG